MARQQDPPADTPRRGQIIRGKTLAEDLDTTLRTIQRWEDKGKFPRRVKLGPNSVGYWVDEVEQWKAARERGPGNRPPRGKAESDGDATDPAVEAAEPATR